VTVIIHLKETNLTRVSETTIKKITCPMNEP